MLRNMKTMKTGKRPPLKDIRQNRWTPTKGSKLVRKYQRTVNGISKVRYRKQSLSFHKDELPQQWRLQPYVRLTRVDEPVKTKGEEKVRPVEVDIPVEEQLAIARCVISSLMIYPNMLGHDDFHCLRSLLLDFGVKYTWDTVELQVPLEASTVANASLVNVNPPLPSSDIPLLFPAVFIRDMVVDPIQKVARIRQYSLMPYMCQAILSLVTSINKTPTVLYDESHTFLYEFMVRFGVKPKDIEEYVEESSSKSSTHNRQLLTKNCSKLKKLGKKTKGKQ